MNAYDVEIIESPKATGSVESEGSGKAEKLAQKNITNVILSCGRLK